MKHIVLFLKAVLLYTTTLSILLFIAGGCERLIEQSHWLTAGVWLTANITLGYICYSYLSCKDVYRLSGCAWTDRLFKS